MKTYTSDLEQMLQIIDRVEISSFLSLVAECLDTNHNDERDSILLPEEQRLDQKLVSLALQLNNVAKEIDAYIS